MPSRTQTIAERATVLFNPRVFNNGGPTDNLAVNGSTIRGWGWPVGDDPHPVLGGLSKDNLLVARDLPYQLGSTPAKQAGDQEQKEE